MKKLLKKFKKNKKGFTLIELIIVIAILAILVGIVGFQATKYIKKSRVSADLSTMDSVENAAKTALADVDDPINLTAAVKVTVNASGVSTNETGTGDTKKLETAMKAMLQGTPKLKSVTSLDFEIAPDGTVTENWSVPSTDPNKGVICDKDGKKPLT